MRVLQYGDADHVLAILERTVAAPDTGTIAVRVYFHGSVRKRSEGQRCLVRVSVRRGQEVTSLSQQDVGIFAGAAGAPLEVSVGGTLASSVAVARAEPLQLHVELMRADPDCAPAGAGGATQISQMTAQLELHFMRVSLPAL